ncbi:LiaF domain-containing protein [Microbispora sp. H11081]|uniref:LiaF domain-containing protein n=1 Tax=Microbispora sp. H11081 TaxID=2729107 RepID=UPI001473727E|nr:LiaF domain-containing protein [Microbispora sp. H11081]
MTTRPAITWDRTDTIPAGETLDSTFSTTGVSRTRLLSRRDDAPARAADPFAVHVAIGTGLLMATWFGRGIPLVMAGTIVALVLLLTSMTDLPKKMGSFVWRPVSADPGQCHTVSVGEGRLDLTDLQLAPGTRVTFTASVSIGRLKVIVPPAARVEVHGFTRLGEVEIDHKVETGAHLRVDRVLEPELISTGQAPTVELRVTAGVGDLEVRRAP